MALPKMSNGLYEPKVGDTVTVELPDERTRAEIVGVVSLKAVTVKLLTFTTNNKSHSYRKGDIVPCRFEPGPMNRNVWRAISDRELDAMVAEEEAKRTEAEAAAAVEPTPKSEIRQAIEGDIF